MVNAHVLGTLLPSTSVKLGRLVINANRPHQEFLDPILSRPTASECHITHHKDFFEMQTFSKSSRLSLGLGDLLGLRLTTSTNGTTTLSAENATTQDLQNSDTWFETACREEQTRRWLEKAIDKGRSVYLVVGIRSASNAKVLSSANGTRTLSGLGAVPQGGPPQAAQLQPTASASGGRTVGGKMCLQAPGEQVFAILYRKVKFSWLSSKKVGNMLLEEGNRWKSVWNWRGPNVEDEEDVLEVVLETESDFDLSDDEDGEEDNGEDEDSEEEEEEEGEE